MKVVVQTWLVGTIVGRDGHKIRWASIQLHCRVLIVMLLRASTPARHTCICHRGLLLEHLAGSSVKAVRFIISNAALCREMQERTGCRMQIVPLQTALKGGPRGDRQPVRLPAAATRFDPRSMQIC